MHSYRVFASALLLALWILVACGEAPSASTAVVTPAPPPPVAVAGVRVVADSGTLAVGSSGQVRAVALDTRSNELAGRVVQWSVDNASVLSVSTSGVVTALAPGAARVIATIEGVVGDATVDVLSPVASSVAVAADFQRLAVGGHAQATATALDATGRKLPGRTVLWTVTQGASAVSIGSTGVITALAEGRAVVQATIDSASASLTIDVLALTSAPRAVQVSVDASRLRVGGVTQAKAMVVDSSGSAVGGYPVTWDIVGAAGLASVSASGLVTAVAVGEVQVRATAGTVSGTASVAIDDVPLDNVALPELPRVHLVTTYQQPTGRSVNVRAGDDLQAALNAARRGDELVLDAGAVFRGSFVLPRLTGSASDGWVIVRSSMLGSLPEGQRVTPAQVALMPRIETRDGTPALSTALGASGWRLAGLEVTVDPLFSSQQNGLLLFGDGSSAQSTLSNVASDLVLDRSFVHGAPTSQVKRCVALNSARSAIIDSYLSDCHVVGFDSQAILGWNGPGPFKIENNTLMGASENIMFGGADPSIPGLVPADIEIRRNYLYTPASWRGVWQKKNLFELKNAERVLLESNVMEGSWVDGQTGYAMQLKIENQSGRCTWCRTADVTVRGNEIRNVGGAFNLAGMEGGSPYPVTERLTRVLIEQNLVSDVNVAPYTGDARLFLVQNDVRDLTIRNNTITSAGNLNAFLYLGRGSATRRFFFGRNIVSVGQYGLFADALGEGVPALAAVSERVSMEGNAVIGQARPAYPGGFLFVPDLAAARAVVGAGADEASLRQATTGVVVR